MPLLRGWCKSLGVKELYSEIRQTYFCPMLDSLQHVLLVRTL